MKFRIVLFLGTPEGFRVNNLFNGNCLITIISVLTCLKVANFCTQVDLDLLYHLIPIQDNHHANLFNPTHCQYVTFPVPLSTFLLNFYSRNDPKKSVNVLPEAIFAVDLFASDRCLQGFHK